MIVRNESKVILRALDSVVDLIDYWVICDTGSTDDTAELIENYFLTNNIPGELHKRPWMNFGHNRNEALELARDKGDYLLLIDADMVVQHNSTFDPDALISGSYLLQQHNGSLTYYNKRLLKNSIDWRCIGVTHEYYTCDVEAPEKQLSNIWIDDIGDGGSKLDKYERDIRLLEEGIRDNPTDARYHFYLAQSYKDVGKTEKAIDMYDRRISLGGWDEEVWYARLMKGICLAKLKRDHEAIEALQASFDSRPSRAEPLVSLCEVLIRLREYSKALACAKLGNTIPFPDNDRLFIDTTVYLWQFDYQITLSAYYIGDLDAGRDATERLLMSRNTPEWVRQNTVMNQCYYIHSLEEMVDAPVVTKKLSPVVPNFNFTNPSILRHQNGYLVNFRGVNFYVKGRVYYEIGSKKEIGIDVAAITRNFLQYLDDTLEPVSSAQEIDNDSMEKPASYPSHVIGYEDGRLIEFDGNTWLLCTSRQHDVESVNQMALLYLSGGQCDRVLLLHGHEDNLYQKNWMPFIHDGKLLLVYTCEPLTILQPNLDTGHCDIVSTSTLPPFCAHLRGGSQGVRVNGYYLFLVHEVAEHADGRHYYHRFLALDGDLCFAALSPAFYLQHKGIEFIAGLCADKNNEDLVIAWGYKDAEARLSRFPLSKLMDLLSLVDQAPV